MQLNLAGFNSADNQKANAHLAALYLVLGSDRLLLREKKWLAVSAFARSVAILAIGKTCQHDTPLFSDFSDEDRRLMHQKLEELMEELAILSKITT